MSYLKVNHVEARRERVAQLNLRGLSSREIAKALAQGENPIVNPSTGQPYDQKTILADLNVLKGEWKMLRGAAIDDHIDREYMEIIEIKKTAWAKKDPELVLKAIDREMKLLGTAKDKDGTVINNYFGVIEQILTLAAMLNTDPQVIFEGTLRRLQRAAG